jgi:catechol 2,3-dioxygenase
VAAAGFALDGASDHGSARRFILRDPENNGVELYRDRPRLSGRDQNRNLTMFTRRLDLDDLLSE